jgi:hypothetical protein
MYRNSRTKILNNSGRVWLKDKIISFWLTQDKLTQQILENTFNNLGINDKEKYFIDVINIEELSKEGTKDKKLLIYNDFINKNQTVQRPISKEEKRKAAELMAKQHGVQGAAKAKYNSDIPEVGAKKYAKQMPLNVRQQVQTSESRKNA